MDIERHGYRALDYSSWHRTGSLRRYLGRDLAATILLTDIDHTMWCEYGGEHQPLLLVESAMDIGQDKQASVIQQLARRADLPAYVVLWQRAQQPSASDERFADIERFRVRRVWPNPEAEWSVLTPQQWAERLLILRARGAAKLDSKPSRPALPQFPPGTQ